MQPNRMLRNSPSPSPVYSKVSPMPTEDLRTRIGVRTMFTPRIPASPNATVHVRFPAMYEEDADKKFTTTGQTLRVRLIYVSGVNTVLSSAATVLGYYAISSNNEERVDRYETWLKVGVCFVSLLQLLPIVLYWIYNQDYLERLRAGLRLSPIPLGPLHKSPASLLGCILECLFHLIALPPLYDASWEMQNPSSASTLTLSDLIFILILTRNYHAFRFLFWYSDFSTRRAYHFASVANIVVNFIFTLRAYLERYSLRIVLVAYGAVVVISGFSVFVFEKRADTSDFYDVRNSLWLIAYTQVSIGYGEITPKTYFGMLATVISCFVGNFTLAILVAMSSGSMSLSLTECTMYSELVYSKEKRKFVKAAVILLQYWWRFMLMRIRRVRDGMTIVEFYSHLRTYREVLTKCQLVKDRRFERQITAFDLHTAKHLRAIIEYLDPIRTAESYVLPI